MGIGFKGGRMGSLMDRPHLRLSVVITFIIMFMGHYRVSSILPRVPFPEYLSCLDGALVTTCYLIYYLYYLLLPNSHFIFILPYRSTIKKSLQVESAPIPIYANIFLRCMLRLFSPILLVASCSPARSDNYPVRRPACRFSFPGLFAPFRRPRRLYVRLSCFHGTPARHQPW